MKRPLFITVVIAAGVLSAAGCATKTYGRLGPLTDFERSSLTCREIDLDVARTDGFIQRIGSESQWDSRDTLAFLGDFGIGNSMEKSAALESATTRRSQLNTLRATKCGATAAAPASQAGTTTQPATVPAAQPAQARTVKPGTCGWISSIQYVCNK